MLLHLYAFAHYHCGTVAACFAKVVYGGKHCKQRIKGEKKPLLVFEDDGFTVTSNHDSNATIEL